MDRQAFLRAINEAPDDDAPKVVYADWLDEHGEPAAAELLRLRVERKNVKGMEARDRRVALNKREQELEAALSPFDSVTDPDAYDWREAFAYAGGGGYGEANVKRAAPHLDVSERPFGRHEVAEVIAARRGENDERNWVCVGRLVDGRWFALDAGCDYTGWD